VLRERGVERSRPLPLTHHTIPLILPHVPKRRTDVHFSKIGLITPLLLSTLTAPVILFHNRHAPKLVILLTPDAVSCGCTPSASSVTNVTVEFCAAPNSGTVAYQITNLTQPTFNPTQPKCNSVPGVDCADAQSDCGMSFQATVEYLDPCRCNPGSVLDVHYDNGVFGLTEDTFSLADGSKTYAISGTSTCSSAAGGSHKDLTVTAKCASGTSTPVTVTLRLTCAQCKQQ
jgi:hypothetical protein